MSESLRTDGRPVALPRDLLNAPAVALSRAAKVACAVASVGTV